jgi:hypothetical protein
VSVLQAALAAAAVAVSPAPADLPYARIATGPLATAEGPVLAGQQVLVASSQRRRAVVRVVGLDGRPRHVLAVPHARRTVIDLAGSEQAVAVLTGTVTALSSARRVPAGFGPLAGPLRAFPAEPTDIGVAGPLVVAFDFDDPDPILVWDVTAPAAAPRAIAMPDANIFGAAAGRYVAVLAGRDPRTAVAVVDLLTGREVYRVPTRGLQDEAIGPDGRVVLLEHARGGVRVVTATPADPARREVARMPVYVPRLAVAESGVAVVRKAPGGLARIVIVGFDGSQRAVTPALNGIHTLDYDGTRLAFTAGRCVFAGPIPAGPPGAAPRDPCFVAPASLDFGRLGRIGQRGGRRLRVPLTCTVPTGTRCTVELRVVGRGFTVRRRTRIPPGRHIVRVRIPAGAWQHRMTLETIERGRPSAGATIPQ